MKKITRFEIEMMVAKVIDDFAEENELESDFYGDCYPQEIMQLENRMERMTREEIDTALEDLKEDLKAWYL